MTGPGIYDESEQPSPIQEKVCPGCGVTYQVTGVVGGLALPRL